MNLKVNQTACELFTLSSRHPHNSRINLILKKRTLKKEYVKWLIQINEEDRECDSASKYTVWKGACLDLVLEQVTLGGQSHKLTISWRCVLKRRWLQKNTENSIMFNGFKNIW